MGEWDEGMKERWQGWREEDQGRKKGRMRQKENEGENRRKKGRNG